MSKANEILIGILIIVVVIVGGGILGYMRYFERDISPAEFPEIERPEEMVEEDEIVDFCEKAEKIQKFATDINFIQGEQEKKFIICVDPQFDFWRPGLPRSSAIIDLYVVEVINSTYQILWEKTSWEDFHFKMVWTPKVIDIDEDGVDEIILQGSNWGGTCTFVYDFIYIYSPEYDEIFSITTGEEAGPYCEWILIEPRFSENLEKEGVGPFKRYLEQAIIDEASDKVDLNQLYFQPDTF